MTTNAENYQKIRLIVDEFVGKGFEVKLVEVCAKGIKNNFSWILKLKYNEKLIVLITLPSASKKFLFGCKNQRLEQIDARYVLSLLTKTYPNSTLEGWQEIYLSSLRRILDKVVDDQ